MPIQPAAQSTMSQRPAAEAANPPAWARPQVSWPFRAPTPLAARDARPSIPSFTT